MNVNPAVQRYVMAYADRERARKIMDGAEKRMILEAPDVWRAIDASEEPRITVDLLDGSRWLVSGLDYTGLTAERIK